MLLQKIRNMLLGSDVIPRFLSNEFTLDPSYGEGGCFEALEMWKLVGVVVLVRQLLFC